MQENGKGKSLDNLSPRLAQYLAPYYKGKADTVVIGLPRGGVPVAYEVAKELGLPLDVVVPRKIGAPFNSEFAGNLSLIIMR